MSTLDVILSPYAVSGYAFVLGVCNIIYNVVKDRPKIKITFQDAQVRSQSDGGKKVDVICITIANKGGPTTILFPDIILPDRRFGGNMLYLVWRRYSDARKRG